MSALTIAQLERDLPRDPTELSMSLPLRQKGVLQVFQRPAFSRFKKDICVHHNRLDKKAGTISGLPLAISARDTVMRLLAR